MGWTRRHRPAVALVLLAGVIAACSTRGGDAGSATPASTTSSPFTVGAAPAGCELVTAGTGTSVGEWGDDSTGTVEPYTVLSPDGLATGAAVVRVAITGYEGYQGGLAQAAAGYVSGYETLTVDGADAIYSPATSDARGTRWADVVVVRGDDVAVRVSSPQGSAEELVAVARRVVVPDDRTTAPVVPDLPDGLRVVGSVDVDGQLAADAFVAPHTDQVPGPRSAHAAGWACSASEAADHLAVLTVPGSSLDLAAVPVQARTVESIIRTSRSRAVEDRPGLVLDEVWSEFSQVHRTVFVEASWGDIVVVRATGPTVPPEEALVALAASVRQSDAATWDRFVTSVTRPAAQPVG